MANRMISWILGKKFLVLILFLSLVLNTLGLYPNALLHPNEPGLIGVADQLFKNVVFEGNPDPNLEPHPFKYASFLFYTQAFARGGFLTVVYFFVDILGFNFGFSDNQLSYKNFKDFIGNVGPYLFGVQVLWVSRFVNVLYGTGCVLLVFLVCQKLFNSVRLSYLSALALALIPHHVRDSHYATADMPLSFFVLLSFFFTIRLWQNYSLKNLILAGAFVGFASALKYYPLAFVPLFLVLFSFGIKLFINRIFIVLLSGLVGYIVAMPYIFVHYQKIFAFVPYVLWWQAPDQLAADRPLLSRFLPTYYHQYPLKFLFNHGILPIPFIMGIFGLIVGFLKYRFKFLIVASVPIFHFLFVNFYVKQIYEYILIPMLPFFAIFIAVMLDSLISFARRRIRRDLLYKSVSALIMLLVFFPQFIYDVRVGLACSEDITDFQARDWIRNNIPENSYAAYHKGTRHPSVEMNWIETDILDDFSLAEVQQKNAEYMIFIDGHTSIYTYWSDDFFIPPQNPYYNQYVELVRKEFAEQGELLAEFRKPYLCAGNSINIYKLPQALGQASNLVLENDINTRDEFNKFRLLSTKGETYVEFIRESDINGMIRLTTPHHLYNDFRNTYFYYSTPLLSEYYSTRPGQRQTASIWMRPETKISKSKRDGYLRLDFYSNKGSDPIATFLSLKGATDLVWQELKVTGVAPETAKFMTVGFQSLSIEDGQSFLIDDARLYED